MSVCLLFSIFLFALEIFREKGPEVGLEGGERKTIKNWKRKENKQNIVYKILKKYRTIKQIGIRIVFYSSLTSGIPN